MAEDAETGSRAIEDVRRAEAEVGEWALWLQDERAPKEQGKRAKDLLSSLRSQIASTASWSEDSRSKIFIVNRCGELIDEVHDVAHRYGLQLESLDAERSPGP